VTTSVPTENTFSNFIAGYWIPPAQTRYIILECEAGKTQLPSSCRIDVDRALRAAHQSSHSWVQLSESQRFSYLKSLERLMGIYEHSQRMCASEKRCAARWRADDEDYSLARQYLLDPQADYSFNNPELLTNKTITVGKLFFGSSTNISNAISQIAPALAAGYTLVIALLHKPDQQQCLQLLSFMEFAAHSLPAGVLNIVYGLGMETALPLSNAREAVNIDLLKSYKTTPAHTSYLT